MIASQPFAMGGELPSSRQTRRPFWKRLLTSLLFLESLGGFSAHAGHFYSILDEGILCCFDAKTGETVWDQRLEGRVRSSLVLAGGNGYTTNDKGVTTVFRATPNGFESVSKNDLKEFCYSRPAIANGRLYRQTGKNLFCIGPSQTSAAK